MFGTRAKYKAGRSRPDTWVQVSDCRLLQRHWNALQDQVSQLDNEITVLRERSDKLETDNKKLANDTKKLTRDVEHLQRDQVRSDKCRATQLYGL